MRDTDIGMFGCRRMNLKSVYLGETVKPVIEFVGGFLVGLNFAWPQAVAKQHACAICRNGTDNVQLSRFQFLVANIKLWDRLLPTSNANLREVAYPLCIGPVIIMSSFGHVAGSLLRGTIARYQVDAMNCYWHNVKQLLIILSSGQFIILDIAKS